MFYNTASAQAQSESFTVIVDQTQSGTITINPAVPANGKLTTGTVVTVTTRANPGFALDAGYFSAAGRFGQMYTEFFTPEFKVTIDREKHIGASLIEESALKGFKVIHGVVYAKPGVKTLKYDVFSPEGAKNLPCIVIIHGGGWTSNSEDIMRGLARELVKGGKYVVVSID